jgi:hypothetical protein
MKPKLNNTKLFFAYLTVYLSDNNYENDAGIATN